MKYGLPETAVAKLCAVFAGFPAVEKAVLYGSRAKGSFKTGSDIDLTLYGEAVTSDLCSEVASALDDLLLPYTIDLSVFEELNHAKLREHIERVGVLFYERVQQGAAMKKGWQKRRLRDVTTKIGSGATPIGGEAAYKPAGISLIRSLNVHDDGFRTKNLAFIDEAQAARLDNVIVEAGDVLLNITGASVARCCVVPSEHLPARVNQHVSIVRPAKQSLLPSFLHYMLISRDYKNRLLAVGEDGGSTRQAITKAQIQEFEVEFPPLPEQQRIVGILDEAFAGIATAKANAEKNLQNARALFESHLQSVFTRRGQGWVDTTVDQISTNLDSKRVPITKNVRTSGKYPYYGASGIVDYVSDYIFEGDTLLVSEDGANLLARSTPIAFSASGKYWVNNHAHILEFRSMATQRFVEFYLESTKLDEYIRGAAQPKLTQKALNSIPIPIPQLVEAQAKVVESVESIQKETRRLAALYERKFAALEALKKSLLHQAFTGQL